MHYPLIESKTKGPALQQIRIQLAHATRVVIAIVCMVFGIVGLLLPVLPGIPLLMIAVWLLVTTGDAESPGALDHFRLAALRIARACLIALEAVTRRLFGH